MLEQGFINIEKIIDQLDIKPNMAIADFGAGHGFFSVVFAKKVGSSGQVFAIDILPQTLEAIRSKAKLEGLFNIKIIRGNLEKPNGSTLGDASCDMVFVANVLFQVSDRLELINEAYRILKKDGELAVVEWKPYIALGPKKERRLSEEEVKQLITPKGFGEPKQIDAGSHHYGFVFKK
ncbi:MAG: class I SAM-dependent methyltransferase [Candidatus Azambacteria bacterium]|nr:class I SAM-dependent methyltransferase [Candidatus Azambacteria bacterium]